MVRGMSDAKHPLIAAEPAHAPPHLIGQRLEAEVAIGSGKGARDRVRRPMLLLRGKKTFNRLFEPSAQQVLVTVVGNQGRGRRRFGIPSLALGAFCGR